MANFIQADQQLDDPEKGAEDLKKDRKLREMALRDGLTGAFNRGYFEHGTAGADKPGAQEENGRAALDIVGYRLF